MTAKVCSQYRDYLDDAPGVQIYPDSCKPIDNHYPTDQSWKCYPELGRKLSENDFGKNLVRTGPCARQDGYDWSWVPYPAYDGKLNIRDVILIVTKVAGEGGMFKITHPKSSYVQTEWFEKSKDFDAGNWTSVKEFENYLKK